LALTVYCANVLPQQRYATASESTARLRFSQLVALSDFDSDGLIDQARLEGSGPRKSIEVILSRNRELLILHFDTNDGSRGSLFAHDVNNDGATDLIWTDLLHADDVVVWLGNGAGRFERVPESALGDGFTISDVNVDAPAESTHDPAVSSGINRPTDHAISQRLCERTTCRLPDEPNRVATLAATTGTQSVRGPPTLLA
jgi:hypothetical protein